MRHLRTLALTALTVLVGTAQGQITEWTTTVAPGKFLLEMDVLSLTFDRSGGERYTGVAAASTFVSTGLTTHCDVQLGAEFFLSQKYESAGMTERYSGMGDVYVRTKWRFYENKTTGSAMAVLPYVKIPTNSGGVGNRSLEGGVIVPWTASLPADVSLAAMVELDCLRNDADDGYTGCWYCTLALSRQLTQTVGLYVECVTTKSAGAASWERTMGAGMTFSVTEKFWWDIAIYRGLSSAATDWNPVLRLNVEF